MLQKFNTFSVFMNTKIEEKHTRCNDIDGFVVAP